MKENTEIAFAKFREVLKKNKLKENVDYEINFVVQYFSSMFEATKIRFELFVDMNETSPLLVAKCLNESDSCIINFALPELTLDNYDRSVIYFSEEKFESPNTYNLGSFKTFLRFTGLYSKSARSSS